jgi:uncharacterized Zn finger protein
MSTNQGGPAERVAVACPTCSPEEATVHEILNDGGQATVRCTECSHVHKTTIERQSTTEVDVIVSQEGESFPSALTGDPTEEIAVGDEFIADTPEALFQVRVTALEVGNEQRVEETTLADVDTVWTRVIDNVGVNVTIHPRDGDGHSDQTRSLKVHVPGDYEFVVGETETFGDEEVLVEGIHVRSDVEYRHDKMDHEGDTVFARDVKRVYARDQTRTAWSGW